MAAELADSNAPADIRGDQMLNYSFLSQTRIRLLDANKNVIADTGPWRPNRVLMGVVKPRGAAGPFALPDKVPALDGKEVSKVFIYVDQGGPVLPGAVTGGIGASQTVRVEPDWWAEGSRFLFLYARSGFRVRLSTGGRHGFADETLGPVGHHPHPDGEW